MKISYQKLTSKDLPLLKELIHVFEIVFEMENFVLPKDEHLQSLLDNENIIFFVAILEEQQNERKVIGGLRVHILPSTYFESAEVYMYDLGVQTDFQRQAVGTQLVESLKNYSQKLGYKEVFVQADLEDQHAIDFYKKTGGILEDVIHFSYQL